MWVPKTTRLHDVNLIRYAQRSRYINATKTLASLLAMGVVPIVNENDTISVQEIQFGDNDTLSAIAAGMVMADYLFLLTDVDCLYTENPRKNPAAKRVKIVRDIEAVREIGVFHSDHTG